MFEVSDTGRGVSAQDLGRVFEPFWQGEAGRTWPEGAGLGLSVSRRLAQRLGGDITVVSTPGQGSTCVLSLSRLAPNEASVPATTGPLPTPAPHTVGAAGIVGSRGTY